MDIYRGSNGWYFNDPAGDGYGPFPTWSYANSIYMAFCLDVCGIGDQQLLYFDVVRTLTTYQNNNPELFNEVAFNEHI